MNPLVFPVRRILQLSMVQVPVQFASPVSHCSPSSSVPFPQVLRSVQPELSHCHEGPLAETVTEASQCSFGSILPFPQSASTQVAVPVSQANPSAHPASTGHVTQFSPAFT